MADATIFTRARQVDLDVVPGRYYLADAGFGTCDALLVPYRKVRYHLAEWGHANVVYAFIFIYLDFVIKKVLSSPTTPEELFNLRHSSLRNVVERIFGIIKKRFAILHHAPEFSMKVQARIPPALCAIHNFIRIHNPDEISDFDNIQADLEPSNWGELALGPPTRQERARADSRRDRIAQDMWASYQEILHRGQTVGEEV